MQEIVNVLVEAKNYVGDAQLAVVGILGGIVAIVLLMLLFGGFKR